MTPTPAPSKDTKRAMELNTIEGAFAVAAENLAAPYLALFALALGATPSQIGMLTAFPNLIGNVLQIPAALWAERMKDKRMIPIVGGYLSRLAWGLLVFFPFLFAPEHRVSIVILLATFRIIAANVGVPAWTALQADLIPKNIRGQYYANRNVVLNTSALVATFLANFLLRLEFPTSYQIIFAGAAILGLVATTLFAKIPFAQAPPKSKVAAAIPLQKKLRIFWREVGSQRDFKNYMFSAMVWNFGITLASSLFVVHFVDNLQGQAGAWAIFAGINLASQTLIQRYWGRLADVFGQKNVMVVSGLGVVLIPLLWWIAPWAWFPVLIFLVNGVVWGGYNLAAFNMLLEITPDDNRSVYVGVYNTMMGFAMAAGPLIGGFAAEIVGLRPVFLSSALVRALGLYIFYRSVANTSGSQMGLRDLVPKGKSGRSM